MNELHVNNRGHDRWEVRIRKSAAINVAYGLPWDAVSLPGVAGAILPAIQSITWYPLLHGETRAPTECVHPLYIPTVSQLFPGTGPVAQFMMPGACRPGIVQVSAMIENYCLGRLCQVSLPPFGPTAHGVLAHF